MLQHCLILRLHATADALTFCLSGQWLKYRVLWLGQVRNAVVRMVGESQEAVGAAAQGGTGTGSNKLPTLDEYGTNLTTKANEVRKHTSVIDAGRSALESVNHRIV